MSFRSGPVTVTVPATSANLGPGFDTLGLALSLRDTLTAEVIDQGLEVEVHGEGVDSVSLDESHLVVRSMRLGFERMGAPGMTNQPPGLRLSCSNVIAHARGLGSSSAAIVGGLALARALVTDGNDRFSDHALLQVAAELEGHPDNVAPALYGGFTVSGLDDRSGTYYAVRSMIDPSISVVVFVPPNGVETTLARGLLPAQVSHADAAANAGRAALLVAAMAGEPRELWRATRDYLHQEYRRPAMPESLALVDTLRTGSVPAVVSGAGPTVLAFIDANDGPSAGELELHCPAGWAFHRLCVESAGVQVV